MKIKLLGYGQIGKALHELMQDNTDFNAKIVIEDKAEGFENKSAETCYEVILVTIPYSYDFIPIIEKQLRYSPRIMIFSTLPVGTMANFPRACHCPIEGRHPNLKEYIDKWDFMVGLDDDFYLEEYQRYFKELLNKQFIEVVPSKISEVIKLLSTLNYGVNIEFMRYVRDVLMKVGRMNIGLRAWEKYTNNYNKLYADDPNIQRYNLTPPVGRVGGHCVGNNAEFLEGLFPDIVTQSYKNAGGRDKK